MATKEPPRLAKVSVIVTFHKDMHYLSECLENCLQLDYPDYEIIVVSNEPLKLPDDVRLVLVKDGGQGPKKDAGWRASEGEICAFVDDDAYPRSDWLKNGIKCFSNPRVFAVCGPGVTPPTDTLLQKASGAVYASFLGSGPLIFRYVPRKPRAVEEFPGYNVLVRRSVLEALRGIEVGYRSGEDTVFSKKITGAHGIIWYAPDVVVFHHRRPLVVPHLKQVSNYAVHRGYFSKKSGNSSSRWFYLLPLTVLASSLLFAVVAFMSQWLLSAVVYGGAMYIGASFVSSFAVSRDVRLGAIGALAIPMTHFVYALGFAKGLAVPRLAKGDNRQAS